MEIEAKKKALLEEINFDEIFINEALISANMRKDASDEVRAASNDGDYFTDSRPKTNTAENTADWIELKKKEDRINAWRETLHLPPIRMVVHNGVEYNIPTEQLNNAVTKAKNSMSPVQFQIWLQNYNEEGVAKQQKVEEARQLQNRWATGSRNLSGLRQQIAQVEARIAALKAAEE